MPRQQAVMHSVCYQVNLQRGFGGGEVYAAALARAIALVGVKSLLYAHPEAASWTRLRMDQVRVARIAKAEELLDELRDKPPAWLLFHTFAPAETLVRLRQRGHGLAAFAHMPLYGRNPEPLRHFDLVFGVSRHVIASLHAAGISKVYPEPMYGIADLVRDGDVGAIVSAPPYDWDRRKFRDRLLGLSEPLWRRLVPRRHYVRRPGLTLGVVSRLTPIKQFPLLFTHIAAVLARHPDVNIEIFGSGGYASVRDLRRATAPIARQLRFWGQQSDVSAVYRRIDALLTGLPEKEALGLNVIEAQACGTPVLAPDAPPFDETVLDGVTGLRYRDPRDDGGADFERALRRLQERCFRIDPEAARAHLEQFSEAAFVARVGAMIEALAQPRAAPEAGLSQP